MRAKGKGGPRLKAPKGHRYRGLRESPTVRQFLWDLFDKGVSTKVENRQKIADLVNKKFDGKRTLHPEYKMTASNLHFHISMWHKMKNAQQPWRKV